MIGSVLLVCAKTLGLAALPCIRADGVGTTPFVNERGHTLSIVWERVAGDAMHNLATAAAAVGRNKNAILRAIEAGKIPVSQDANGDIQIDPADLHRIYPPLRTGDTQQQRLYQSPLLMPVGG